VTTRIRGIFFAVLLVAACARQFTKVEKAGYTPKWRVGDWWIVKSRMRSLSGHGWQWDNDRYDVVSMEKVEGKNCLVLRKGDPDSPGSGPRKLYYIRTDDFRIIRRVEYFWQAGKLIGPVTADFPDCRTGPDPAELLPMFPLDAAGIQDSIFRIYAKGGYLRQLSGPPDSDLLRDCRNYPDTSQGHPVQPRDGKLYSVLCESGTPRGPTGQIEPFVYSLQLWSEDFPWRLYWEQGRCKPPWGGPRYPEVRSWLSAFGHTNK
jgi:hypothetical protein